MARSRQPHDTAKLLPICARSTSRHRRDVWQDGRTGFAAGGVELRWCDEGSGPLLLLHGSPKSLEPAPQNQRKCAAEKMRGENAGPTSKGLQRLPSDARSSTSTSMAASDSSARVRNVASFVARSCLIQSGSLPTILNSASLVVCSIVALCRFGASSAIAFHAVTLPSGHRQPSPTAEPLPGDPLQSICRSPTIDRP